MCRQGRPAQGISDCLLALLRRSLPYSCHTQVKAASENAQKVLGGQAATAPKAGEAVAKPKAAANKQPPIPSMTQVGRRAGQLAMMRCVRCVWGDALVTCALHRLLCD